MIDLHSHILPGIDDGATDLAMSLEMARIAVADGIRVMACTPHVMPGVYDNNGPDIWQATANLQQALDENGIALRLVPGCDAHLVPDLVTRLRSGQMLTLANSRYVLVEPAHHVPPLRLLDTFFNILVAGFQPVLTHPERLGWIRDNYPLIQQLSDQGVWMQITASSVTGAFGREPKYWSQRMLAEGRVHILASDCHNPTRRPPNLRAGFEAAAALVGEVEATHLVLTRPQCILENATASAAPVPAPLLSKVELNHEKLAGDAQRGSGKSRRSSRSGDDDRRRGGLGHYLDSMRRLVGWKR